MMRNAGHPGCSRQGGRLDARTRVVERPPTRLVRWPSRAGIAAALALALPGIGCSEKPPAQNLIWAAVQGLPTHRAALTSVVASSRERVIVLGYDRPEGLVGNIPLSLIRIGSSWSYLVLPDPAIGGSVLILATAEASDGSIWAVGRVADFEPEPSLITPVVYRYAGGAWTEVPIGGVGELNGVELHGVAASGTGTRMELRFVGSADYGQKGIALRYALGVWNRDSLPPNPIGASTWTLSAIGRGPNGQWLAAGGGPSGSGGVVFVDAGAGWVRRNGASGYFGLQLTALGFDAVGKAWLGGNYPFGDSLQGALFQDVSGTFSAVDIRRKTSGGYQIYAMSFDAEGHGWVAGGRSGYQPFLAGSAGGPWIEDIARVENEAPGSAEIPGGGDLFGICVLGEETAIAVGYKQVIDVKGLLENELGMYELIPHPIGEVDLVAKPSTTAKR
jgi:hypothetical protein